MQLFAKVLCYLKYSKIVPLKLLFKKSNIREKWTSPIVVKVGIE